MPEGSYAISPRLLPLFARGFLSADQGFDGRLQALRGQVAEGVVKLPGTEDVGAVQGRVGQQGGVSLLDHRVLYGVWLSQGTVP
jgi:hypothetical protein